MRLSQLVTAASYNGADVSAFPQKVFFPALTPQPLLSTFIGNSAFYKKFAAGEIKDNAVAEGDQGPGNGVGDDQAAQGFVFGEDCKDPEYAQNAGSHNSCERC